MPRRISSQELINLIGTARCPDIIDVRRKAVFDDQPTRIAGALWRDHMTIEDNLPRTDRHIVVYCAHGHNVSEIAAARLAQAGIDVLVLDGGIEAFEAAGGQIVHARSPYFDCTGGPGNWVTRERPKIDRIACPWLIRRFVDPHAAFHFVAAAWVRDIANETARSLNESLQATLNAARLEENERIARVNELSRQRNILGQVSDNVVNLRAPR